MTQGHFFPAHRDRKCTVTVSDSAGSLVQGQISDEKIGGGNLRKYASTQVVDLSALSMLASINGFILRCFQLGGTNGAEATAG